MSAARLDILGIGTLAVDDLLHVASYPPTDSKAQLLRTARQFGGLIDHAIVSLHFAAEVTGVTDPREAVRSLHGRNPRAVTAVTCGVDGCWFMAGSSGETRHQAARRVKVVETTGCGDVFHGAYAAALARGAAVEERSEFATAAATVYASRPSGWDYLPTPSECGTC